MKDTHKKELEKHVTDNGIDYSVYLKDRIAKEKLLLEEVKVFGKENPEYLSITKEMLDTGKVIFDKLKEQEVTLQQQEWKFKVQTFNDEKQRWTERVNTIKSRGISEWGKSLNDFYAQWNKWKRDTQKQIEERNGVRNIRSF